MSVGRPKDKFSCELEYLFQNNLAKILCDAKILPPKNEIWSILRDMCSVKKTGKAIYTAALKWFKNINKLEKNNIDEDNIKNMSFETSLDESSETTLNASNDDSLKNNKDSKNLKIQISSKVWRTIAPIELTQIRKNEGSHRTGVRKYFTLQPGL